MVTVHTCLTITLRRSFPRPPDAENMENVTTEATKVTHQGCYV